jgi:hypothetical protein
MTTNGTHHMGIEHKKLAYLFGFAGDTAVFMGNCE